MDNSVKKLQCVGILPKKGLIKVGAGLIGVSSVKSIRDESDCHAQ